MLACTRAVREARPYERNRAVWFLWGTAIIDNIRLKLRKTDQHIMNYELNEE